MLVGHVCRQAASGRDRQHDELITTILPDLVIKKWHICQELCRSTYLEVIRFTGGFLDRFLQYPSTISLSWVEERIHANSEWYAYSNVPHGHLTLLMR